VRNLAAEGEIADLVWEAPADLTAEHGQLRQAARPRQSAATKATRRSHDARLSNTRTIDCNQLFRIWSGPPR
jgi:hypothetical protein